MRILTQKEINIMQKLLHNLPDKHMQRVAFDDLEKATVDSNLSTSSKVLLIIEGYERPVYKGQHKLPVEAVMKDCDGAEITINIYVDENCRLFELEFIRWDANCIQNPIFSSLDVY